MILKVTETGAPWIDMAHIVQCLNKVSVLDLLPISV